MSGTTLDHALEPDATEVRERAALWLMDRRDCEDWSADDQAALDTWLEQSVAHRVAYLRVEAAWRRTDRLAALRRPTADEAEKKRSIWMRTVGGVAAIAVCAFVAVAANYSMRPAEQIYATSVGGHKSVSLGDGSKVELNTDTVLRAAVNTRYRTVWLDRGEAYFQIARDRTHPFAVMVGDRRVMVLGTKFIVRRDGDHLEVAVVEGRVRLEPADGGAGSPILLTPGDDVVAPANALFMTRKTTHQLADELGWRHGVLVFDHTTLGDAAAEFNRYNREKLIVADRSVARMTIDGTFQANNIGDFAHLMQTVFGLHVESRAEETVISR
jgi:transmembrane sensor